MKSIRHIETSPCSDGPTRSGSYAKTNRVADWLIEHWFFADKGLPAYIPLAVLLLILSSAAVVEAPLPTSDTVRYECYAVAFWHGASGLANLPAGSCQFLTQVAQFHTFPFEYPPLTLVLFSLPLLWPWLSYPLGFAIGMALIVSFIFWALLRYGPRGSAAIFAIFLAISSFATVFTRFDIVPAGLTLLCLILVERKHWTLAYVTLALAVLTKLYPIVFFPLLFVAEQHARRAIHFDTYAFDIKILPKELWRIIRSIRNWHFKNGLIFVGVLAGVTALFGLLNFKGAVLGSTAFFITRPFQVESVGSVLLWVASLFGVPVGWEFSFGSLNILSPLSNIVAQGSLFLLYLGCFVVVMMLLIKKIELKQAFLATLLVLLATSKIFSPQYLIWLIPLLAYSGIQGKLWWTLWGATSILTVIIYPGFYILTAWINVLDLPALPGFLQIITSRNEVIIFLTLAYLFNWFKLRQGNLVASASQVPAANLVN